MHILIFVINRGDFDANIYEKYYPRKAVLAVSEDLHPYGI